MNKTHRAWRKGNEDKYNENRNRPRKKRRIGAAIKGTGIGLVYLQSCRVADGLKVDIMSGDPFTNNAFTHDRYMV